MEIGLICKADLVFFSETANKHVNLYAIINFPMNIRTVR